MTVTPAAVAWALIAAGPAFVPAAPPGAAAPDATGTYSFAADDGEAATWTLTPCAGNAPGCVRVSETGNAKRAPWSADAHLSVGSWILVVGQPDAILCPDGPSAPGLRTYSWGAVELTGNASVFTGGACGAKPESLSIPFRLTKLGAAPPQAPSAPPPAPAVPPPAPTPAPQEPVAPPPTPAAGGPPAPPTPALPAESSAG